MSLFDAVAVPCAYRTIEQRGPGPGWTYRVQAIDGYRSAIAGPVWRSRRVGGERTGVATTSSSARQLALELGTVIDPVLRPLAELAAFKLALGPFSMVCECDMYLTVLQPDVAVPENTARTIKVGPLTDRPGLETERSVAYDAGERFGIWADACRFVERRPSLRWIEDPVPIERWPRRPLCPIPVVTGEHATSVDEIARICDRLSSTPFAVHLELSRLGPVAFVDAAAIALAAGADVLAHGHLPIDSSIVAAAAGLAVTVELNLAHLAERCGPVGAQLVDGGRWPFTAEIMMAHLATLVALARG